MDNIEGKLIAYFDGALTTEEKALVDQWAESSVENKIAFIGAKRLYDSSFLVDTDFTPDVNAAWYQVKSKMDKQSKTVKFQTSLLIKIAAVLLIVLGVGYIALNQFEEPNQISVKTYSLEKKAIMLPDGTLVVLNENSELTYPEAFNSDERKVSLKGQAFFDVKRDESAVFRIVGSNTGVNVLGTAFDVISNDNYSEVNVVRGSVEVENKTNQESVVLIKDQRAVIVNNELQSFESLDYKSIAWRSDKLEFQSVQLHEVVKILSDYFGIKITIDNNIRTCRITSKMDGMSIDEILEILEVIANIKSVVSEDEIVLSGPSC